MGVAHAGEKAPLDRPRIVAAALDLLDEGGIAGLSTRKLADRLGIKSASLYWHFKDKDELLDEMCGAMFVECLVPPDVDGRNFVWEDWLAEGARRIRRMALSRKDGAQIMARQRPRPVTLPYAFSDYVKTLQRSGLSEIESMLALQTMRRFAVGSALQEQATIDAPVGDIVLSGDEGFEFGLQAILDGLRARLKR